MKEGIQVKLVTESHRLASQCKPTDRSNLHRKSKVHSPFLWSVFNVMAQNKPQEKGRLFWVSQYVSREKRQREGKNPQDLTHILKEENLSYLGTLHFGTLCFLASDLPFITHAEVTASTIPHLTVVPDSAIIQAVSLGRYTLLTALPRTMHFVLPLQNISNHWAGLSEPTSRGTTIPAARVSEVNDFLLPSHR